MLDRFVMRISLIKEFTKSWRSKYDRELIKVEWYKSVSELRCERGYIGLTLTQVISYAGSMMLLSFPMVMDIGEPPYYFIFSGVSLFIIGLYCSNRKMGMIDEKTIDSLNRSNQSLKGRM